MSESQPASAESIEIRALHGRILAESQALSRLRDVLPDDMRRAMEKEIARLQAELDERIAAGADAP